MNKFGSIAVGLVLILTVAGCTLSETGQRTATGSLMGAAIGAGVGATGGFLYGKHKEAEQEAYNRGRADASSGR